MNIARAFEFVFADPQWVSKLVVTAIIAALSLAFTPFIIGLAGWAILLGYQIALISNMRAGVQHPLPRWDDISEYFSTGGQALIGGIVYYLPILLLTSCVGGLAFAMGGGDSGSVVPIASLCCVVPLVVALLILIIPVYGLALGRFTEQPSLSVFFQFSSLFAAVSERRSIALSYLVSSVIASIILGAVNSIPCIGWVASLAMTTPVMGALTGQYVMQMLKGSPKRKLS